MITVTCDICGDPVPFSITLHQYTYNQYCQPCKVAINEFNDDQREAAREFKENLKTLALKARGK